MTRILLFFFGIDIVLHFQFVVYFWDIIIIVNLKRVDLRYSDNFFFFFWGGGLAFGNSLYKKRKNTPVVGANWYEILGTSEITAN